MDFLHRRIFQAISEAANIIISPVHAEDSNAAMIMKVFKRFGCICILLKAVQ